MILSFARALFSLVFLSPPGTREFLKSDGCRVEGGIGPRDISFIPRADSQLNCTPFYRDIFIPRGIKSSVAARYKAGLHLKISLKLYVQFSTTTIGQDTDNNLIQLIN